MKYFLNTNTNEKYGFSQNDDIPSIFFEAPFIEISVNEIDEMNKPSFSLEELKARKLNEITNQKQYFFISFFPPRTLLWRAQPSD